jgi:hypothetical protein
MPRAAPATIPARSQGSGGESVRPSVNTFYAQIRRVTTGYGTSRRALDTCSCSTTHDPSTLRSRVLTHCLGSCSTEISDGDADQDHDRDDSPGGTRRYSVGGTTHSPASAFAPDPSARIAGRSRSTSSRPSALTRSAASRATTWSVSPQPHRVAPRRSPLCAAPRTLHR